MHFFCLNYQLHLDPQLQLYGNAMPVVSENIFLGIIFNSRLTFVPHLKYLKNERFKSMNLLCVISHMDWRSWHGHFTQNIPITCHIKTWLCSARKSYLQSLDTVQNCAYRTSPAPSLQVESNHYPLELRRNKLPLQYILKLSSTPYSPAYVSVFGKNLKTRFAFRLNLGIKLENQQILCLACIPVAIKARICSTHLLFNNQLYLDTKPAEYSSWEHCSWSCSQVFP